MTASDASVRAPPHHLPTRKIPTSPHARIVGANGVPQRNCKFPQSQIFPHRARTTKLEFYHAPCAPRAVWAQTGLVRGDFVRRIHFLLKITHLTHKFRLRTKLIPPVGDDVLGVPKASHSRGRWHALRRAGGGMVCIHVKNCIQICEPPSPPLRGPPPP